MHCWWEVVEEEKGPVSSLDVVLDQWGVPTRSPHPHEGRQWQWKGKHRTDADGRFVCEYKSWRTPAEKAKIRAAASISRESLTQERDQFERGTTVGTVCVQCGRLITYVMANAEYVHYQDWRERNRSYGDPTRVPWYVPGERDKKSAKAHRTGRQWKAKHVGTGETFECRYDTALRPKVWTPVSAGGCERCGRLKEEGRHEMV